MGRYLSGDPTTSGVSRTFFGGSVSGSGGGLVAVRRARNTSGNVNPAPNTSGAWQLVANTGLTLPAAAGDYVELSFMQMVNSGTSVLLDWVVVVGGSIVRAASSDTATPLTDGLTALYHTVNTYRGAAGPFAFTAVSGDISGGNITFQLAVKAAGSGVIYRSTDHPIILTARNYGVVDDG